MRYKATVHLAEPKKGYTNAIFQKQFSIKDPFSDFKTHVHAWVPRPDSFNHKPSLFLRMSNGEGTCYTRIGTDFLLDLRVWFQALSNECAAPIKLAETISEHLHETERAIWQSTQDTLTDNRDPSIVEEEWLEILKEDHELQPADTSNAGHDRDLGLPVREPILGKRSKSRKKRLNSIRPGIEPDADRAGLDMDAGSRDEISPGDGSIERTRINTETNTLDTSVVHDDGATTVPRDDVPV